MNPLKYHCPIPKTERYSSKKNTAPLACTDLPAYSSYLPYGVVTKDLLT